jgi:hypothetical protein
MHDTITEASTAPTAREPAGTEPSVFSAPHAVTVLRAWRAWAGSRLGDDCTGFALLYAAAPTGRGALVLVSDQLRADQLAEIGRHSRHGLQPLPAALTRSAPVLGSQVPLVVAALRAVDDGAIESFLRTGEDVCRSLIIALRHRAGRFELVAWPGPQPSFVHEDVSQLVHALGPWLAD